jgi:serine phosphatase RsbU (regulator of sigma subunit)
LLFNPRLQWASRYEPGGRSAQLGGDFFDGVELDDGTIRVVVGDVSGHGPDAAALGVALRVAWRTLALSYPAGSGAALPGGGSNAARRGWLHSLERILESERISDEVFATVCDIELEPSLERAAIRLGGHPAPLLFANGTVRVLPVEPHPPLMGNGGGGEWPPTSVELGKEWTLLAFTDGLIEGRVGSGADRLGERGLEALARRAFDRADTLASVADMLVSGAERANGAPLPDDVAVILLSTSRRWAV